MAVYISVSFLDAGSSGSATAQGQVVESSAFTRSAGSFKAGGYEQVSSTYGKINAASEQDLLIEGENYSEIQGMQTAIVENYKGRPGKAVATEDAGTISWKFDVRQEGLYNLSLMILQRTGKGIRTLSASCE